MSEPPESNSPESGEPETNEQDTNQNDQSETKAETNAESASPETVTLYVGNLSFQTTSETLTKVFSEYGQVVSSRIIPRSNGTSKGFGFVEMNDQESGQKAIDALNGKEIDGREIKIEFSKGKPIPESEKNRRDRYNDRRRSRDRYDRSDRYDRYDRYDRDPYRRRGDRDRDRGRRRAYDDSPPPRRSRSRYDDSASD